MKKLSTKIILIIVIPIILASVGVIYLVQQTIDQFAGNQMACILKETVNEYTKFINTGINNISNITKKPPILLNTAKLAIPMTFSLFSKATFSLTR